jgi:hypothetical protein
MAAPSCKKIRSASIQQAEVYIITEAVHTALEEKNGIYSIVAKV